MVIKPKETKQKLSMKDDILFKAFFSKKGNERFIKDFLTAILGEEIKIKRVTHDSRLEQLARESKYGVLDLDVELEDGRIINVEMQMRDNRNIEKRTTFYASKKITEQLGAGEEYKELKKVIVISILDYSFIELPEYVIKTVRAAEEHREYKINNEVEYCYIELEKFRKGNPDMTKPINQWLAFIDMERGDLLEMAKKNSKIIREAYGEYEVLTGEAEAKRLEEIRQMSRMEEKAALSAERERGTEEGKKEGQKQKQVEIARNMLEEKLPLNQIIKLTGLTEEEISNINTR